MNSNLNIDESYNIIKISDFINEDIFNIIIPFYQKTSFYGVKSLNFKDFCSAASLIEKKEHLTIEGARKMDSLIAGINNNRKWESE